MAGVKNCHIDESPLVQKEEEEEEDEEEENKIEWLTDS